MTRPGRVFAGIAALGLAVTLAGCGLGQQAVEQAAEQAAEQQLGDGSDVEIDGDGSIKIDSSEGSINIGTGELPEGWPSDIPSPAGFELVASFGSTAEGQFNATWQAEGDRTADAEALVKGLEAAGYAPGEGGNPITGMWVLEKGDNTVSVLSSFDGTNTVIVVGVNQ